jgi:hypothetical protein
MTDGYKREEQLQGYELTKEMLIFLLASSKKKLCLTG